MINNINKDSVTILRDDFKTVIIDKTGNKKLEDGFDSTRDLVSYSAKYDENKNILLKIKLSNYDEKAFNLDSAIVLLLDFLKDHGTYILPFNIKGATDHWWEIAYKIKGKNIDYQISQDLIHKDPQEKELLTSSLEIININPQEAEVTVKIDLSKLKQLGWNTKFPLYLQILTVKGEVITDSFNDPKPYENANFLVGAMPINKFLEYNSKCLVVTPH